MHHAGGGQIDGRDIWASSEDVCVLEMVALDAFLHCERTSHACQNAALRVLREQTYLPQLGSQSPACPVDEMMACQFKSYQETGTEGRWRGSELRRVQKDVTLEPIKAPEGDT